MRLAERTLLEFKEVIGKGGFGTVFRATLRRPKGFQKEVAVKVLHDRWVRDTSITARLRDEARVLGLVRHRALPTVDGLYWVQGRPALVVEFVDGVTLQALRAMGPVPLTVALEIGAEIANALHTAYTADGPDGQPLRLIHRDIKPGNLQITRAGEVKILDFGIARADFDNREAETEGHLLGSIRYMSPERLDFVHGPEGDVYAIGIVLVEILMGRRPDRTSADRDRHSTFLEDVRNDLRGGDMDLRVQDVEPTLLRMLAYAPAERPTAREVERTFRKLRNGMEGPSLPEWAEVAVARAMEERTPMEEPTTVALLGRMVEAAAQGTTDTPQVRWDAPTGPKEAPAPVAASRAPTPQTRRWAVALGLVSFGVVLAVLLAAFVVWSDPLRTPEDPTRALLTTRHDPPSPTRDPAPPSPTGDPAPPSPTGDPAPPSPTGDPAPPSPTGDPARPSPTGESPTTEPVVPDPVSAPTPPAPTPARPVAPTTVEVRPAPVVAPAAPVAPAPPAPEAPRPASPTSAAASPVSSGAFASFLGGHAEWGHDEAVARHRAADGYLSGWNGAAPPSGQPWAVSVSWYAAAAYCAGSGGLASLSAPPTTWTEGSGPFQEWRVADGGGAAWIRFDGVTSTAVRRTDANAFTGFRCAR